MKKIIITVLLLCSTIALVAQSKGKTNPVKKDKLTLPINKDYKKSKKLDEIILADIAVSKCERHNKYSKLMWKVLITSNPSTSNPLHLSNEIKKLRILPLQNVTGHITFEKTAGTVAFPEIVQFNAFSPDFRFPVYVTGSGHLIQQTNSNSTIGFYWESGNYSDVIEVVDLYKVGSQAYADIERSNGIINSIMIFPEYQMDGCALQSR